MIPRSAVPEVAWPAIPDRAGALLLALQYQLQESERLAPDDLQRLQLEAMGRVLRHAVATVPHYRDRPAYAHVARGGPLTAREWRSLPVLGRSDVQEAGASLQSENVPPSHLPVEQVVTSGATGRPVRAVTTAVTKLFWRAITLRDQLWHRRDVSGRLAGIRDNDDLPPDGRLAATWGPSTGGVYRTGPAALFSVCYDVATQAAWLVDQNPHYLLTYPSNLVALAHRFRATGDRLPNLRQACSYGEALGDSVRPLCREVWGVDVVDMYSAQELGYVALQCPGGDQYHVQAESLYVEVLDDRGDPCGPGEIGRVVVTTLHNYAMPLLRYEVGDYAEVAAACPCGRGLPALRRILGRRRNMWALPGGRWIWPQFTWKDWGHLGAVRQLQLVQRELHAVEARVVGPRPLTEAEEGELAALMRKRFGYRFDVFFSYPEAIDRTRSRKFEDFVSLVPRPPDTVPEPSAR